MRRRPTGLEWLRRIHPLSSIVQAVGGSTRHRADDSSPRSEPHTFEPRPAHVRSIADARLFLQSVRVWTIGRSRLAAFGRAAPTCSRSPSALRRQAWPGSFAVRKATRMDTARPGEIDPHVWLDPILVKDVIAPAIAEALSVALPDHRTRSSVTSIASVSRIVAA